VKINKFLLRKYGKIRAQRNTRRGEQILERVGGGITAVPAAGSVGQDAFGIGLLVLAVTLALIGLFWPRGKGRR